MLPANFLGFPVIPAKLRKKTNFDDISAELFKNPENSDIFRNATEREELQMLVLEFGAEKLESQREREKRVNLVDLGNAAKYSSEKSASTKPRTDLPEYE